MVHTYPTGVPPCDAASTLQACIDSVAPGDEVQLETNGPIDESISITKSLTLRASPGFDPEFAAGRSVSAAFSDSGSHAIDVEGLYLQAGSIRVTQGGSGPLTAIIAHDTCESTIDGHAGIDIEAQGAPGSVFGDVSFDLSTNVIVVTAAHGAGGIRVDARSAASASGRIAGNEIEMDAVGPATAIDLYNTEHVLDADVVANRISGADYPDGIYLAQDGVGSAEVRVLDDLVVGQGASAGAAGAIAIYASQGGVDASIVNNTVADGEFGIYTRVDPSGSLAGLVANNIVSGNSTRGLTIDPLAVTTLANGNNLVFGNASDSFVPGPGTVTADPLFAAPDDYHVQLGSPAIAAGDPSAVPSDLLTDLDGNPRTLAGSIDIGAYQAPEPGATLDAMAGIGALGLLGRRRRRPLGR